MNKRQRERKHKRRREHGRKPQPPMTFNIPEGSKIRFLNGDIQDWMPHKFIRGGGS